MSWLICSSSLKLLISHSILSKTSDTFLSLWAHAKAKKYFNGSNKGFSEDDSPLFDIPITNGLAILSKTEDPDCNETKYLMLYLLAVYLRYMALFWGATGGVYLSGSIVNSLLLDTNFKQFRDDFEDSSKMNSLLKEIPIFLIKELNLGFKGALKLASSS